jgi:hypothetical protein
MAGRLILIMKEFNTAGVLSGDFFNCLSAIPIEKQNNRRIKFPIESSFAGWFKFFRAHFTKNM